MKIINMLLALILSLIFPYDAISQDKVDVMVKGYDDGIKTSRQRDYEEAKIHAMLQAIEKSGVEIESYTYIKNFEIKKDKVEARAKSILLPGFQITDIGYLSDNTYVVILTGKVEKKSASKKNCNKTKI